MLICQWCLNNFQFVSISISQNKLRNTLALITHVRRLFNGKYNSVRENALYTNPWHQIFNVKSVKFYYTISQGSRKILRLTRLTHAKKNWFNEGHIMFIMWFISVNFMIETQPLFVALVLTFLISLVSSLRRCFLNETKETSKLW